MSAIEALANAGIGLIVSWLATLYLLPFWGLHASPAQSAGITGMFFGLSFARAYALRVMFARWAE